MRAAPSESVPAREGSSDSPVAAAVLYGRLEPPRSLAGFELQRAFERHERAWAHVAASHGGRRLATSPDLALVFDGDDSDPLERAAEAALALACQGGPWAVGVGLAFGELPPSPERPSGALFEARAAAVAAPPGGVLLAESAARRLRGGWLLVRERTALQDRAALWHGSGDTVRLVGPEPPERQLDPPDFFGRTASLIGRQASVEGLLALLGPQAARSGRVLLTGPAGVGKTRLAASIGQAHAAVDVIRAGRGAGVGPLGPLILPLRERARVRPQDDLDAARRRFQRVVGNGPAAEALASLCLAGEEQVGLTPKPLAGFLDAISAWYRALGQRTPVLLVVDGLDRLSEPLRDLLALLSSGDALAWVLATAREAPRGFVERGAWRVVPVEPLGAEGCRALVRDRLAGLPHPPADLVERLVDLSGGLPLAVEEAIRDLVASGALVVGSAERPWRIDGRRPLQFRPPELVVEAFTARFRRLPWETRRLLGAVAVSRSGVWPSLLGAMLPDAPTDALESLARRGLLEVRRSDHAPGGERGYALSSQAHAAAVLATLAASEVKALHRAGALALEAHPEAQQATLTLALAEHWEAAGELERALERWEEHARQVARQRSPAHSAFALVRTLAVLDRLPVNGPRELRRQALVAALVEQLVLASDLARAIHLGEQELLVAPGTTPEGGHALRLWLGWAYEHAGRYREALAAFASAEDGAPAEIARLARLGALAARSKLGDADAVAPALRELAAELEDDATPRWASLAWRMLGNAELRRARYSEARAAYQTAHALGLRAFSPEEVVDALNGLTAVLTLQGEYAQAVEHAESGLEEARRWDLLHAATYLETNRAEALLGLGRGAEAAESLGRTLALHRQLGNAEGVAETSRLLAEAYVACGAWEPAVAAAEEARVHADAIGTPYARGMALRTQARAAAGSGDPSAHQRYLEAEGVLLGAGLVAEAAKALAEGAPLAVSTAVGALE